MNTPAAGAIMTQIEKEDDRHLERLEHLPLAPVDVFPVEIQAFIQQAVKTFGTTSEIVISALLSISGGLIGARRLLKIKSQWTPHAALYLLICAPTGDSKSPVINWLMEPVEALEWQWLKEHRDLMDYYEQKLANLGKGEKKPEKPIRKQIKIGDVTSEALVDILAANPSGLIRYRDEGRSFFTDADKYSGATGSDQTKYLEAYDRRPIQVDRVRKERVSYVHRPCISLFGSIQPKVLMNCFSDLDTASGYLGRFMVIHSYLETPPFWNEASMSAADVALWHKLVNAFITLDMIQDENGCFDGRMIALTPAAKDTYIEYYNEMTALPFVETDVFREIISKTKEHVLRLCLILHCMEHAVAGTDDMQPVTEQTMQKAIKLAEWVYSHNVKTWRMIVSRLEEPDRQPVERRIAQAIFDLKDQIKNGVLLTTNITAQVNQGHAENFHLKAKTVGRICANRLKLTKSGGHTKRGWLIDETVIEILENDFSLVQTPQTPQTSKHEQNQLLSKQTFEGVYSKCPQTPTEKDEQNQGDRALGAFKAFASKPMEGF